MTNMEKARIQSDPKVMMGKPVIAGTRITVELLLEKLSAGETAEQIKEAYPHLPEGAIQQPLPSRQMRSKQMSYIRFPWKWHESLGRRGS